MHEYRSLFNGQRQFQDLSKRHDAQGDVKLCQLCSGGSDFGDWNRAGRREKMMQNSRGKWMLVGPTQNIIVVRTRSMKKRILPKRTISRIAIVFISLPCLRLIRHVSSMQWRIWREKSVSLYLRSTPLLFSALTLFPADAFVAYNDAGVAYVTTRTDAIRA